MGAATTDTTTTTSSTTTTNTTTTTSITTTTNTEDLFVRCVVREGGEKGCDRQAASICRAQFARRIVLRGRRRLGISFFDTIYWISRRFGQALLSQAFDSAVSAVKEESYY